MNREKYLKTLIGMISGSMLAQLIVVLTSPLLTRLFTPAQIGLYTLMSNSITMFSAIMCLRYEMCIITETKEETIFPLMKFCFYLTLATGAFITLGYLIYFKITTTSANPIYLALGAGCLAIFAGFVNVVTAYNNRKQNFANITKSYVGRVLTQTSSNMLTGLIKVGAFGLTFSHILGFIFDLCSQSRMLIKEKVDIFKSSIKSIKDRIIANKNQVLFSTPAAFANGLSYSLITYFIQALYNEETVGYYSISFKILGLPLTVIALNVSKLYVERANREKRDHGSFHRTYETTVIMMSLLGIPMLLGLETLAPWVCEKFLGSNWRIAGNYIQLLAPLFVARFIATGINSSAMIARKQNYDLLLQVTMVLIVIVLYIVASANNFAIEKFLTCLSACITAVYIAYLFIFWQCSKTNTKN